MVGWAAGSHIKVQVQALPAPLSIQFPANKPRKAADSGDRTLYCNPCEKPRCSSLLLASACPTPAWGRQLQLEPEDGRLTQVSPSFLSLFLLKKIINYYKKTEEEEKRQEGGGEAAAAAAANFMVKTANPESQVWRNLRVNWLKEKQDFTQITFHGLQKD